MKNKGVFIVALILSILLKVLVSKGQDTIRMSVYFDYGKSVIKPSEKIKLDSLFTSFHDRQLAGMRITGNTDLHGGHQYNMDLSDARARSVYDYFAQKGLAVDKLEILGQGKTLPAFPGEDETSRAGNRRTDIEVSLLPPEQSWTGRLKDDSLRPWYKHSDIDETYPNGIRLVADKDALFPYKMGDLQFAPECNFDVNTMLKEGFTTMTESGEALASAGVFNLKVSLLIGKNLPDSFTFNKPVEVWIPITACACMPGNVMLWDSVMDENNNIVWVKNKDEIHIERIGLKKYYVFPVRNAGSINLDCPQNGKAIRLAFRHYQAVSVKLVYSRAKAILVGKPDNKGRISVTTLKTKEIPRLYAVAVDDDETTYQIKGKRLSAFRKNPLSGNLIVRKQDFRRATALKIKKVNKEEVIFGYVEQ